MKTKRNKKNKRRRTRKHLFGGSTEYSLPPPPIEPESVERPVTPTLSDNLESAGNLAVSTITNLTANGINAVGKTMGIDPTKPANETIKEVTNNLENVVDVLKSPEGEKLKQEASELLSESLDIVKPSIEKGQEILDKGVKKLADTGTGIVVTALNEIPPVFLLNELSKFGTAGAQAGETVAELTTVGADAIKNLESQKARAESIWGNFSDALNKGVANSLNYAQKTVDKFKPRYDNVSPYATLKKINSTGKMIGGRVASSQLEFLSPYDKRGQNSSKTRKNARRVR